MSNTAVQAKVTRTSATAGSSIDVSGITGDWTLNLEIFGQDTGDVSRFTFEDSVDAFTTVVAGPSFCVSGQIGAADAKGGTGNAGASTGYFADVKKFTIRKADYPDLRLGTASAVLRLNLTRLSGSSPHVTFQAWIDS